MSSAMVAARRGRGPGEVPSRHRGVDRVPEPGMASPIPTTPRACGRFAAGVGEAAVVTEEGRCRLSRSPRRLLNPA